MTMSVGAIQVSVAPAASAQTDDHCLARFHFGGDHVPSADGCDHFLTLEVAAGPPVCEEWRVSTPVRHQWLDGISQSVGEDHAIMHWVGPVGPDIRSTSREVYSRLLDRLRHIGFRHVVKGWNHVPDITGGEGDRERYRQFCLGRGEAMDKLLGPATPPAGTAVGAAPDTPLQVILLAQREPTARLENPRQVAAFRYPRQYGPHSPTFSRGSITCGGQLFVSGTAAIVGHESQHEGSLEAQIRETIRNWESLLQQAVRRGSSASPGLTDVKAFRVYVREPYCMEIALRAMHAGGVDLDRVIPLRAGICRRELLFELDGIVGSLEAPLELAVGSSEGEAFR